MTSEPHPHHQPQEDCRRCRSEARFLQVFRALWTRILLPCREVFLDVELRHIEPDDMAVLLLVADVHGAPVDALAICQVSMDMFEAALDVHREAVEEGAPDADERLGRNLAALARPVVLTRTEARRILVGLRRLFPDLVDEAQAEGQ